MTKKFYAVRKGFETGIFNSWDECRKQIEGYSGAVYKSFTTYDDAYKFLNLNFEDTISNKYIKNKNVDKSTNSKSIESAKAYVDGSYSNEYRMYSFGIVILHNNQIVKLSGVGNDEDNLSMRNVAGELLGAMEAIKWAVKNKMKKIYIYYDYEGIEKWALGVWKANKKGTKYYKEFIDNIIKVVDIEFIKVKAHTGVHYNEEADRLAKNELNSILLNNNVKEYDKIVPETHYLNQYKDIFVKIMSTDITKKTKNQNITIFRGMKIDNEKIKKVVKEIWKIEKRKISEMEEIHTVLDIDKGLLLIEVIDINKETYNYEILL